MKKIKHTASFEIAQPTSEVFPLFSAEGEKLWVPGWNYENIMGDTELHEDYIFLTRSHDHATTDAIWLVKQYDPDNCFIQLYKIEPEDKVGIIEVKCTQVNDIRTKVEVTYQYIALSGSGRRFIAEFTSSRYEAYIAEWETLLVRTHSWKTATYRAVAFVER